MADPGFLKFATLSLHAGQQPDLATGARAVPIHPTTAYVFRDADQAAALFDLELAGHVYSRISNPTVAVLEERLAALEGGVGAVCTASGQAALHLAIATLMGTGGHIVASSALYAGSRNLLAQTLPRFGITTTFVPPRDADAFAAAIRPETRLVFGEVIGNPGLEVLDIAAVAGVAHAAGLPLMIDSTFATPHLCRPLDHGADLVMHSATKWLGGHGAAVAGVLVDGGRFDWARGRGFPTLCEPYPGYDGLVFTEQFGPAAFIARARFEGLRDFGATLAPDSAARVLLGVETLALRMDRHVLNARLIAQWLADRAADPKGGVVWVSHPDLPDHPDHALARRLMPAGAGSVVTFGIAGGRAAGRRFIESLRVFSHVANVGDAKSLVTHPASTTHAQLGEHELARAGIGEEMIRLSVGLEDAGDLIDDLAQALRAAGRS
ncbi:MAG TPA: O-acetylhomoserine aminocarboxypropyltransferase [Arenibaculum sp.]|nr:O-acetylhomoserine aminocarboxypropyltransferase [Arenibaculum sp.]